MLEDISYPEVDTVLERLLEVAENAAKVIDPRLFTPMPDSGEGRLAVVDGGSAVLYDLRALLVGVYRAGFLVYENGHRTQETITQLQMVALDKASSPKMYADVCEAAGFKQHNPPEELDAVLERLRYLLEMKQALGALEYLEEGDVLALDGSLRADITHPRSVISGVVEKALEKGVSVVGVSKSSSLHINGLPVLSLARHSARGLGLQRWLYPIGGDRHAHGDVYAACFHPGSRFSFRVEVAGSMDALGCLAGYSGDASILGYPSPLASIHNSVAIPHSSARGLGLMLESRLATMPSARSWPDLLTDFHSILDMGV